MGPKTYEVRCLFTLSPALPQGEYILALAILDPAGMLPAVRFAIEDYFTGGWHPIGIVGVGEVPPTAELEPASFDDPTRDRTLHHELGSSAHASPGH